MHFQGTGRGRNVAVVFIEHALDMFPFQPVDREGSSEIGTSKFGSASSSKAVRMASISTGLARYWMAPSLTASTAVAMLA